MLSLGTRGRIVLIYALVALIVAISLGILIWGFNKGFLPSDGGFYLLQYQDIQPSQTNSWTFYHILVKAAIPSSLRTIKGLRYIGFFLNLLASALFGYAIHKTYRIIHGYIIQPGLLILMMLAGFLLSYPGMPCELSYNSLAQFFLITSVSLLLLSIYQANWRSDLLAALSGFSSCLVFAVKPPSGLFYSAAAIIALLIVEKRFKGRVIAFALPILAAFLLFLILKKPDLGWYYNSMMDMLKSAPGYSLRMLVRSTTDLLKAHYHVLGLAAIIGASWWLYHRKNQGRINLVFFLVGAVLLSTVYFVINALKHIEGGHILYSFVAMPVYIILVYWSLSHFGSRADLEINSRRLKTLRMRLPIHGILLLAPYFGGIGSYVTLDFISKYYLISVLGFLALALPWKRQRMLTLAIAVFSLYLTCISLWQYVEHPFGYSPLYEQTIEYKGIKYDPFMANYLKTTQRVLEDNDFDPRQGIIAAYVAPGIVYLMDSYQPGGPLWRPGNVESYMSKLKETKLEYKPVIIFIYSAPDQAFVTKLKSATRIDFRRDYRLVACYDSYAIGLKTSVYFPYDKAVSSAYRLID